MRCTQIQPKFKIFCLSCILRNWPGLCREGPNNEMRSHKPSSHDFIFCGTLRHSCNKPKTLQGKILTSTLQNIKTCSHIYWSPVSRDIIFHFVKSHSCINMYEIILRVINIQCLNSVFVKIYPTPLYIN